MLSFLRRNFARILFVAAFVFFVVLILISASTFRLDNSRLQSDPVEDFSAGWYIEGENGKVVLPVLSRAEAAAPDMDVTFYHVLPETLSDDAGILIQTKNENVRAACDGVVFYEYGFSDESSFGSAFGAVWNLIPLPEDAAGKTLSLELSPRGGRTGTSPYTVLLGCRNALYNSFHDQNRLLIHICNLLLLITFTLAALSVLYGVKKDPYATRLFFFSCFTLLAALWTYTDGMLLQLAHENKAISYYIFNFSFLLLPVPFALYVGEVYRKYRLLMQVYAGVGCVYFFLRVILYMTGVNVFEDALYVVHLLITACIATTMVIAWRERKTVKEPFLITGLIVFGLYEGTVLVIFWAENLLDRNRSNYATSFFFGLLLFVFICLTGYVKNVNKMQQTALKAQYYEQCAYTDILTGCKNRTAFERDLEELQKQMPHLHDVSIVTGDLNYFKQTNDLHGHAMGDDLLKAFFSCMQEAFGSQGTVYRIGGDEAAVLLTNLSRIKTQDAITAFYHAVDAYNAAHEVPIAAAIGFVHENLHIDNNFIAEDLLRRADRDMYRNKAAMKEEDGR